MGQKGEQGPYGPPGIPGADADRVSRCFGWLQENMDRRMDRQTDSTDSTEKKATGDRRGSANKDTDRGIVDRFYIALFSALEQTHCTCM